MANTCTLFGSVVDDGTERRRINTQSSSEVKAAKHIDFPPPVGSDTKVSFPAAMLFTASRCSFLSVTLSFLLVWSKV